MATYAWDDKTNAKGLNAAKADFLTLEEHFEAIEKEMYENKEEEIFIRQQIWWLYNDRIRNGEEIFSGETDELRWIDNLNQLLNLLDRSDLEQRITVAEINRNLGNFDTCMKLVEGIDNDRLNRVKEALVKECQQKNRWVIKLN